MAPSIVLAVELERNSRAAHPAAASGSPRSPGAPAEAAASAAAVWPPRPALPVGPQLAGAPAGSRHCGQGSEKDSVWDTAVALVAGRSQQRAMQARRSCGRTRPTLARGRAPSRWSRSPLLAALLPAPAPRPRRLGQSAALLPPCASSPKSGGAGKLPEPTVRGRESRAAAERGKAGLTPAGDLTVPGEAEKRWRVRVLSTGG